MAVLWGTLEGKVTELNKDWEVDLGDKLVRLADELTIVDLIKVFLTRFMY